MGVISCKEFTEALAKIYDLENAHDCQVCVFKFRRIIRLKIHRAGCSIPDVVNYYLTNSGKLELFDSTRLTSSEQQEFTQGVFDAGLNAPNISSLLQKASSWVSKYVRNIHVPLILPGTPKTKKPI